MPRLSEPEASALEAAQLTITPEHLLAQLLDFEPVAAPFISLYLDARTKCVE